MIFLFLLSKATPKLAVDAQFSDFLSDTTNVKLVKISFFNHPPVL